MFTLPSRDSPPQTSNEVQAPHSLDAWKHQVSVYARGWWKMQSCSSQTISLLSFSSQFLCMRWWCPKVVSRHTCAPGPELLTIKQPKTCQVLVPWPQLQRSGTHSGVPWCPPCLHAWASSLCGRGQRQWQGRVGGGMNTQGLLTWTWHRGSLHPDPGI